MPSSRAPSMPTKNQIQETLKVTRELCPGARIASVGPEGISFAYPDAGTAVSEWADKPFGGDA